MKIAVVSDSHGDLYMLDRIIESLGDIDMVIHLGDHYDDMIKLNEKYNKEIIYVAGNNDWDMKDTSLREKIIKIDSVKIFLTHGHRYGVYTDINKLFYRAKELSADIVLFGHTHRQFYLEEDGITIFNPGSVAYPRDIGYGYGLIEISDSNYNVLPMRM